MLVIPTLVSSAQNFPLNSRSVEIYLTSTLRSPKSTAETSSDDKVYTASKGLLSLEKFTRQSWYLGT